MKKFSTAFLLAASVLGLTACGPTPEEKNARIEQQRAAEVAQFKQNGFEIVGTLSQSGMGTSFANSCYTLKKIPDNSITYKACISHGSAQPHIYKLEALEKGLTR